MRLKWDMYWKAANQKCCGTSKSKCENCPYLPKNAGGMVSENNIVVNPEVISEIEKITLDGALNPKFYTEFTADQQAAIVQRLRFWRQHDRPFGVNRATLKDFQNYFGYDN